jgi:hypothetical protein
VGDKLGVGGRSQIDPARSGCEAVTAGRFERGVKPRVAAAPPQPWFAVQQ